MFHIELLDLPGGVDITKLHIGDIATQIATLVPRVQHGTIHVAYITDEMMQSFNHQYRGIDATTDVLSFHYFDDFAGLKQDEVAGEIVLSASRIVLQSEEHGHSIEREIDILIVHGILHILGFDHESDEEYEAMWKYEGEIRNSIGQ